MGEISVSSLRTATTRREGLLLPLSDDRRAHSAEVSFKANPAFNVDPPQPPRDDVLINKTGSTNGFSTYIAFVSHQKDRRRLVGQQTLTHE